MKEIFTARLMSVLTVAIGMFAYVCYQGGCYDLLKVFGTIFGIIAVSCIIVKFWLWLGFK